MIVTQRKLREESENNMLDLIKQLVSKVKKGIEDERRERETSHDNILGLVEEACNKITFRP